MNSRKMKDVSQLKMSAIQIHRFSYVLQILASFFLR
jgi:hypothetical protein